MANLGTHALLDGHIVPIQDAHISVTSAAVLYGLSVYSVFYGSQVAGQWLLFRLHDHLARLAASAQAIGFGDAHAHLSRDTLLPQLRELIAANQLTSDQLFRITLHATEPLPGVRTRDVSLALSVFVYDAAPILPPAGARIKTSYWRRTADAAIPARAKVNGAYVNSALARQDALDAGCDDAVFLNHEGHVSELSAANIFMVKNGTLITPDCSSDILEGITRRSIIALAQEAGIEVVERKVALTELYAANEVFACGTSAFLTPILEIDKRLMGTGEIGNITDQLRTQLHAAYRDEKSEWVTVL